MNDLKKLAVRLLAEERAARDGHLLHHSLRSGKGTAPSTPTATRLSLPSMTAFRAWYWRNAEMLTDADRRHGYDTGGFCVKDRRWLSYPEQQRGACSWCVVVDPGLEPEYWKSHASRSARQKEAT
jgi:hypothetical protein